MQTKPYNIICLIIIFFIISSCDRATDSQNINSNPIFINTLSITKDTLPTEAKACLDKNSNFFSPTYFIDYINKSVSINNNGYVAFSLPTNNNDNKKCQYMPFIANDTEIKYVGVDTRCSKTDYAAQNLILSYSDNDKMLFLSQCYTDSEDHGVYYTYKNKSKIVNLDEIPELKDVDLDINMMSTDMNFLLKHIDDKSQQFYSLEKYILLPPTLTNVSNFAEQGDMLLADDGLKLVSDSFSSDIYLCSAKTNGCDKLAINKPADINISNNGTYIYYNNLYTNKLNLLKLPQQEQVANILELNPDATINNITNQGSLLLLNYKNPLIQDDTSSHAAIYSYKYKKIVDIIDVIKAVKLGQNLVDNKFYGDVQISANGEFLLFFFGQDKNWDQDLDSKQIKEIDRIYLPYGVDELIKNISALDSTTWFKPATLSNSDCEDVTSWYSGHDHRHFKVNCIFKFSAPIDAKFVTSVDWGAYLHDKTNDSNHADIVLSSATPGDFENMQELKVGFIFEDGVAEGRYNFIKNHDYIVRTNVINVVTHNTKISTPLEFTFKFSIKDNPESAESFLSLFC